jgi:hypothetical protein
MIGARSSRQLFSLVMIYVLDQLKKREQIQTYICYFVDDVLITCDGYMWERRKKIVCTLKSILKEIGMEMNDDKL